MSINRADFEHHIKNFQFKQLFNELGWDHAVKKQAVAVKDEVYQLEAVAQKKDFLVFICSANDGKLPDANARKKIDREINKLFFEHLLIFTDSARTKQIWQLSVKEPNKPVVIREITYHVDQKPELLYQKLMGLLFTFDEEGKIGLVDVVKRVSESFTANAEKVTKKFYDRFKKEHSKFRNFIEGIQDTVDRDWYTSLMLNRLMFIYFIQKKNFLDDNPNYLRDKLQATQTKKGTNKFYSFYKNFLRVLFHKGLGAPENLRSQETLDEIGQVPYLNGGLFDVHQIEESYANISIPDEAFAHIFDFFDEYNWHLDTRESATGKDINPDVIGYIFEKYINDRAAMGAYYTKEDITDYISKNCIIPFLFEATRKECANAFREDSSLWQMLRENPDRYIYDAVKHGVREGLPDDWQKLSLNERLAAGVPQNIAVGIDTTQPNLLERRQHWNTYAPPEFALPTEIWREVIERRKRYWDIRSKIENGEINHINDFITYNLNIRQFAQDAIEQYEGSDFVNAFYSAIAGRKPDPKNANITPKQGITILDPACGSGAFLFAALNVLEPLYEACIERMENFMIEDDEQGGRRFPQFRRVLAEIQNHPNLRYYIYKSIILNNLYGVDIMKEAVEIAKLRLFLKLMAEVDDRRHVEPMPDIDYNIRAGNSLVGFATYDALKKAIGSKLDFGGDAEKFREQADIVGRAYKRFKEIQMDFVHECEVSDHESFKEAKDELEERLENLNQDLDQYLAKSYGVDPINAGKFDVWKESHQPFHWFAEFYEIVYEEGGFDIMIGNPPYVLYKEVKPSYSVIAFQSIDCGDLFAFILERSLVLSKSPPSRLGFIIPLSCFTVDGFKSIQSLYYKRSSLLYISNWSGDAHPSKLFEGVNKRLHILLSRRENVSHPDAIYVSKYSKWYSEERLSLFQVEPTYQNVSISRPFFPNSVPKIHSTYEIGITQKIQNLSASVATLCSKSGVHRLYYTRKVSFFLQFLNFIPEVRDSNGSLREPSELKTLRFASEAIRDFCLMALNSSLFYWFYIIPKLSDCLQNKKTSWDCKMLLLF